MIVYRKYIYDINYDNGYSIYQYDTETDLEREIWGMGDKVDGKWYEYISPGEYESEIDMTEDEMFLEML